MFRVPLVLEKTVAVIHRLNTSATANVQPFSGQESGYDSDFREPIVYDDALGVGSETERQATRIEYPPVRIPCQVEPVRFERLYQRFPGDRPDSNILLVMHRMDLLRISMIDPDTNAPRITTNDRVSHLESFARPGVMTQKLKDPGLYVFEVQPASFGFGPDGFDLHLVFLSQRERVT